MSMIIVIGIGVMLISSSTFTVSVYYFPFRNARAYGGERGHTSRKLDCNLPGSILAEAEVEANLRT